MSKLFFLFVKYKSFIMYGVFGVLTTLVNLIFYYFCSNLIKIQNVPSTIIAWFFAVAFAFITNKLWVFDSKAFDGNTLKHEILTFLGARIGTGLLDVGIMYLCVDVMNWNNMVWKLISNIVVIILNYVASRLLIFNKK